MTDEREEFGIRREVLDHGFVELVDSMPARTLGPPPNKWGPGDQRVVDAARVSIAGRGVSAANDDPKLLRYLMKNLHTSPFEKVRFEFHVKLPIFVARQWIRHRTGSFNEMSARYGEMPNDFYVPEVERMQAQSKNNKQGSGAALDVGMADSMREGIRSVSERSYDFYQKLLAGGLARELARMVLPVNLYTEWFWTVDLHNLMHFLRLRLHSHAQYEIRVYAEALLSLARSVAPWSIASFEETLSP